MRKEKTIIFYGTFRDVNELAWDRVEWKQVVASNQSQVCLFYNDNDNDNGIYRKWHAIIFGDNMKKLIE